MEFDDSGGLPLFQQVANQIKTGILNEAFPEETQVPSTTEISKTYHINPATVLKGMNLLVDEGLLEKKRGIGMFVVRGAYEKLSQEQTEDFLNNEINHMISEAKRVGISKDQLIQLIERRYTS